MAPSSKKQKVEDTTEPIYFYGVSERPYGIFSQFQKGLFTDPNHPSARFNCAEQYMMYSKAQTFNNHDIAAKILTTTASSAQKKLGRQIKGFKDEIWDKVKCGIVERGNYLKFSQNEKFKKVLLETEDRELVEAASNDKIWGIGYTAAGAKKVSREQWGQNLLGIALMNVRRKIRAEEAGEEEDEDDEATESANQTSDEEDDPSDEEVENVPAATKSSATRKRKHDSITKGAPKLSSSSKGVTSEKKSVNLIKGSSKRFYQATVQEANGSDEEPKLIAKQKAAATNQKLVKVSTGIKGGFYQATVEDAEDSDEEPKKHSKLAAREKPVASKNRSFKDTTGVGEELNQLPSTKTRSKKHDSDEESRPLKKKKKTSTQTTDDLLELLTKKAADDSMVNGPR
ncbi:hypothetical protein E4T39_04398 [Aureobasidium subglaciale]|nr:hypothetical protein E4T39_04398 [Aureobasidium subglaciale]